MLKLTNKRLQYCQLFAAGNKRFSEYAEGYKYILSLYGIVNIVSSQEELKKLLTDEKALKKFIDIQYPTIQKLGTYMGGAKKLFEYVSKGLKISLPNSEEIELFSEACFKVSPLRIMDMPYNYLEKLLSEGDVLPTWSVLWDTGYMFYFENKDIDEYNESWSKILKNLPELVESYKKNFNATEEEAEEAIKNTAIIELQTIDNYLKEEIQFYEKNKLSILGFYLRAEKSGNKKSWYAKKAFGTGELHLNFKIYICNYSKLPLEDRVKGKIAEYFKKNPDKLARIIPYDIDIYQSISNEINRQKENSTPNI